ncbi:MAG: glycoside hydrolase family 15 protein, partial [Alphaproteobacteria bacterium]|nr:glycoside hydrolase family 15 protein [Alphaproteobacteria bacterium]
DYALIGDCETAALVGRDGSIDWLCWPAFDGEACMAALLGGPGNGRWMLAPVDGALSVSRAYVEDTLVLQTQLETADGEVEVTDFMPIRSDHSHLVRIVRGKSGRVRMRSELDLKFGYGAFRPWLTEHDGGVHAVAGPDAVLFHADAPIRSREGACHCEFEVAEGERLAFSLSYFASHRRPPGRPDAHRALTDTVRRWKRWAGTCTYEGPWREAVIRSLITLKALTYRPTGGLVAATTSSIPEIAGGARNWDYRFCWLRDATFTILSLLQAGYVEEAAAWRDWLLRAVAGDPDDLQPIYTITGARWLLEWEAPWLSGFDHARPVRFGNAASGQHQLDAFGEVVDALYQAERHGVSMTRSEHHLQQALIEQVEKVWRKPDRGIWEVRGPPQRFTHSQVMAWVAVDRGVKAAEHFRAPFPADRWRALRETMHKEIAAGCYSQERQAFTQAFGSTVLDASVLLMPHVGFLPATDPRMVSTVEAIQRDLMWNGFVRRYRTEQTDDGLEGGEGVFLACTFWLAENLIMQGRRDDAAGIFERMLSIRNDVGLLSEEYDVSGGRLIGNFPQALSHLALVNTALGLSGWGPAQERGRSGDGGSEQPRRVEHAKP